MIAAAHQIVLAGLLQALVGLCTAEEHEFFRWDTPRSNLGAHGVGRRQSPPPGYHPQFGSCGTGTTCESACGANWLSCQASTNLSLFCYNKVDLGQSCCGNGSGRACDRGFYCAWQEFGGRVWCCEDGQSPEECGVPGSSTTRTSTGTPGPTDTSTTVISVSKTITVTDTMTGSGPDSTSVSRTNSQCPGSTITSWATTTVSFAFTVTVTETVPSGGCHSDDSTVSPPPSTGSTTSGTTITKPPASTSTSKPPTNSTATSSIVTAGGGSLKVLDGFPLAFLALGAILL